MASKNVLQQLMQLLGSAPVRVGLLPGRLVVNRPHTVHHHLCKSDKADRRKKNGEREAASLDREDEIARRELICNVGGRGWSVTGA